MLTKRMICTALFMGCLMSVSASAHRYVANDGAHVGPESALVINDPSVSQVVYHEAVAGARQLWLTFAGTAGQEQLVQLGVPVIEGLEDYRPALVLVGPGLPANGAPLTLPDGAGALVYDTTNTTPDVFGEEFTGTESWILVEDTVTLPETGTYYVVGAGPEDRDGKFWIAVGQAEVFGLADILSYPQIVQAVREFHEVSGEPLPPLARLMVFISYLLSWFLMRRGLI